MSMNRMSVNRASVAARQRQTRTGRMTRHTIFTMKRPITFQVRRSLVECVDMELADMETSVFYQRIFILAKNCRLTPPQSESGPAAPVPDAGDQGEVGVGEISAPGVEFGEDPVLIPSDSPSKTTTASNMNRSSVEVPVEEKDATGTEKEVLTHTFRFGDDEEVVEAEEAVEEEEEPPTEAPSPGKPKDFFAVFTEQLQQIHKQCKATAITPDPMCGVYIYMGEYSLLMLETAEDMMGCFCRELANCCEDFWQANRVFLIEDHIHELYTKDLIFRRIPAVFLNEKFPTSTPTDEYLMGKQHLIIKEKLLTICRLLSEAERLADPYMSSSDEDDLLAPKSKTSLPSDQLPVDVYRKHLPEIQRIELVLASTRFYYDLAEFNGLYGRMPFGPDEEGLYWPIQNNYTPGNIFWRSPYDINLTFSDYTSVSNRRDTATSLLEEGAAEGGEAPAKEESPQKAD
ncbi:hypothetical protein KR074_008896 [Drosophila pseudoananassae]|nr:hypothetical protein KR074_008896 [Drosophila pseudoananassae]